MSAGSDRSSPRCLGGDPLLLGVPVVEGYKVLDPAVLYQRVGVGGMGVVFRGRHLRMDCDVAVKVLKPDLGDDRTYVRRFEREARLAARLTSENVVRVLDVREHEGMHYLVMEFVEGESARERVERKGPLDETEALAVLLGAVRGLASAHRSGIVHRDIKPDNILISVDGVVKLADLGLAKAEPRTDRSMAASLQLSQGIMGTPLFMPPEQWKSTDVTAAADVWSLGVTLYHLLVGQAGIRTAELYDLMQRILHEDYPRVREARPDVRPEVCDLVARCTARDPAERPADAGELLRLLHELAPGMEGSEILDRDPPPVAPAFDPNAPERGSAGWTAIEATPPPRETVAKIELRLRERASTTGSLPPASSAEDAATVRAAPRAAPSSDSTDGESAPGIGAAAYSGVAASVQGMDRDGPQRRLAQDVRPARSRGLRRGAALAAAATVVLIGAIALPLLPRGGRPQRGGGDRALLPGGPAGRGHDLARAAFEDGMRAMLRADGVDDAVRAFERALELDPRFDAARRRLVTALCTRAREQQNQDPESAWQSLGRARALGADDPAVRATDREIRPWFEERLVRTIGLVEPQRDAVLADRSLRVTGRLTSQRAVAIAVALVEGIDGRSQPFPDGDARAAAMRGPASRPISSRPTTAASGCACRPATPTASSPNCGRSRCAWIPRPPCSTGNRRRTRSCRRARS